MSTEGSARGDRFERIYSTAAPPLTLNVKGEFGDERSQRIHSTDAPPPTLKRQPRVRRGGGPNEYVSRNEYICLNEYICPNAYIYFSVPTHVLALPTGMVDRAALSIVKYPPAPPGAAAVAKVCNGACPTFFRSYFAVFFCPIGGQGGREGGYRFGHKCQHHPQVSLLVVGVSLA